MITTSKIKHLRCHLKNFWVIIETTKFFIIREKLSIFKIMVTMAISSMSSWLKFLSPHNPLWKQLKTTSNFQTRNCQTLNKLKSMKNKLTTSLSSYLILERTKPRPILLPTSSRSLRLRIKVLSLTITLDNLSQMPKLGRLMKFLSLKANRYRWLMVARGISFLMLSIIIMPSINL